MIVLDFETRSACDLKSCGASVYANHPSTEVLCLAYSVDGGEPKLITDLRTLPEDLYEASTNSDVHFHAHNAGFEINIWNKTLKGLVPHIPISRWRCTAALAAYNGLPRSLSEAAIALGLPAKKDSEGHALMLKMCKPKKDGGWHESPEDLERLGIYCLQDVRVEAAVLARLGELPEREQRIWELNERINEAGVPINLEAVQQAFDLAAEEREACEARMIELTGAGINQISELLKWLEANGCKLPDLRKATVEAAIPKTDGVVREVLLLREKAGKSSTAKLKAMLSRTDRDGRCRGNITYYGAQATGRFAGSGVQLQNMPRGSVTEEQIEEIREVLHDREAVAEISDVLPAISSCLRSFIHPPQGSLVIADYASIEVRVLAWLAGQADLCESLATGSDVYKEMASAIYNTPIEKVDKSQRQIGKMAILGCGYGMGADSFKFQVAEQAKITMTRAFARRVIKAYREKYQQIRAFWANLNAAAINAVKDGSPQLVGKLAFFTEKDCLKIELPVGRCLSYQAPTVDQVVAPWTVGKRGWIQTPYNHTEQLEELGVILKAPYRNGGFPDVFVPASIPLQKVFRLAGAVKHNLKDAEPEMIDQVSFLGVAGGKYTTKRLYGGLIAENVTQAVARDFLCDAMLRMDQYGLRIISHVHDEVVVEQQIFDDAEPAVAKLMVEASAWGRGCPIAVEASTSRWYRK